MPAAVQLPPGQREAIREAARARLAVDHLEDFVRQAWPIIEPGRPLSWNWHLSLICGVLERMTRGELLDEDGTPVRELVICVPPGTMKSILVSVMWPVWMWLQRPTERNLCLSNDNDLVKRDSRRAREIITSEWYTNLVKLVADATGTDAWTLKGDQNELINFGNTLQGFRQCLPMLANVTGKRGHGLLIDDPYDAKEAILGSTQQVLTRMLQVREIYYGVLSSRLNDRRTGYRVVIMQRLHEEDLAGEMIRRGAYSVVLPMEYDPDHPNAHPDDPRTEPGELLFPELFPRQIVDEMRGDLGARNYAAQHQQRPSPAEGAVFMREHLRQWYRADPQRIAFDEWAISVDCTFKRSDSSDYVSLLVWGRQGRAKFYLLDRVNARLSYTETRATFVTLCAKWPQARLRLIETKANGEALIDDLKTAIPGLVGFDPKASKPARAQVAARFFEAGNVYLPHPDLAPWIHDYVEQLAGFGAGAPFDDDVDATSQILLYWNRGDGDALERARRQFAFLNTL